MPDYAEMYFKLFNAITQAEEILQRAQQYTEELYISWEQPELKLLTPEQSGNCDDQE